MRINRSFWFVVILVLLLGIVVIDGSSILFSKWQLSDQADGAASDAAAAYRGGSVQGALTTAQASLDDRVQGAKVTHIDVDPQTGSVTITVKKTASTLFIKHISFLRGLTELKVESTGTAPLG